MANNVLAMSEQEIKEYAQSFADKNGFSICHVKKLPSEYDYYLRIVLAHSESRQEYATWLFNVECGGLHHGHYFNYWNRTQDEALTVAMEDYWDRG